MQYLQYKSAQFGHYAPDVRYMLGVLAKAGYMATEIDVYTLWEHYSSNRLASWLVLPDDEELLQILLCGFGVGPAPEDGFIPSFWPDPKPSY